MIVIYCVIGGLILLDKMAVGEFGISQPIIACPLIGLIFNEFYIGLFLGTAIQLVWVGALPLGSKEPPDNQTAGVVAITNFLLAKKLLNNIAYETIGLNEKIIFTCLLFAGLSAIIGLYTAKILKNINNRYLLNINRNSSDRTIKRTNLYGLITSFIRGFITIAFFQILLITVAPLIKHIPRFSYRELLIVPLIISASNLMRFVITQKKYIFAVLGMLTGLGLWIIFIL